MVAAGRPMSSGRSCHESTEPGWYAASYVRLPDTDEHRPFGLALLGLEDGLVAEVTNLTIDQFRAFGLPSAPTARSQGAPDR
jgi:hypothetical protein